MISDKPMFETQGYKHDNYNWNTESFPVAFMEDGSVRRRVDDQPPGTWIALGDWKWDHEACAMLVFIPGHTATVNMESVVTKFLSWLTKQVVN